MLREACADCGKTPPPPSGSGGTGYGAYNGAKVCYACCAKRDREHMREHGRITLYLTGSKIANWPGTLEFTADTVRKGQHNIARTRTDVWFRVDGEHWHGVQYGENTQIVHCKRVRHA